MPLKPIFHKYTIWDEIEAIDYVRPLHGSNIKFRRSFHSQWWSTNWAYIEAQLFMRQEQCASYLVSEHRSLKVWSSQVRAMVDRVTSHVEMALNTNIIKLNHSRRRRRFLTWLKVSFHLAIDRDRHSCSELIPFAKELMQKVCAP